ncbi:MAG: hypothetical protein AAFV49_17045 [Pseudomonadota bacterium]
MRTILLAGTAAVLFGAFVAVAQDRSSRDEDRGWRGGPHAANDMRPARHHGRSRGHRARLRGYLQLRDLYDTDGDGRVTQAEIDATRTDRVETFDADADGALSIEEYEALWLDAMRDRMVRRFQRHDRDGDGQVTAEEFQRSTRDLVLMRDRNEDGALDADDFRRRPHSRRASLSEPGPREPRSEPGLQD